MNEYAPYEGKAANAQDIDDVAAIITDSHPDLANRLLIRADIIREVEESESEDATH